ncbi:hypothetical protein B0T11DRAFT_275305 [Plectosphaerella cucumerina]|uniref:Uncharacterized protein n=1 Tax=Plectosphaerella cucumerina TaxID=40658 RepID=A0A8K0X540_9PEZI|nr:hypothetical protein B0T11DRAFT_275305 [Plectosphaerella cucumerina]
MEALAKAGVSTVKKLAGMEFYHIERILKRNPPFGQELVMKLEGFPMTGMRVRVERWATPEDEVVARKIEGFPCPEVTGARRLALVRVQVWVANKSAPCWRDKSPWVCVAAERGMRPAGHHVGAARRGPQPSTMSANPDGAGELLFEWRCSTKTMLGEGRTALFMAALVPGEAFFLWMSCEEIVGTLIETVVKAPVE